MNDSVSVIIPARNAAATLGRCLERLRCQTKPPLEVIVVDDGSTDATRDEACAGGAVVLGNTRRGGPAGARNTGATVARGEILAFIDSDCIPPADWLEKLSTPFVSPQVGAVGGGYHSGSDQGFWQRFCHEELAYRRRGLGGAALTLVSNNFACRRAAFLEAGGFPEQFLVCEDMLLSSRIARSHQILWLEAPRVVHHFKDSLSAFLRHQYLFGKESMFFFLKNPGVLVAGNHQGRQLHGGILLAGAALAIPVICFFLAGLGRPALAMQGMLASVGALGAHAILYRGFLRHLAQQGFPARGRAYSVSLLRDAVCFLSAFAGLKKFLLFLYRGEG